MNVDQKNTLPSTENALPGRAERMPVPASHFVNGNALEGPFPDHLDQAIFGLGCFWGAEQRFWEISGVFSTSVGYAGGITTNPTYEEVCTGLTGHTEVVRVVFGGPPSIFQGRGIVRFPEIDLGHPGISGTAVLEGPRRPAEGLFGIC